MNKILLLILFAIISTSALEAQNDSLKINENHNFKVFAKKQYVPLGLIITGSVLNIGTVKEKIEEALPETHTHIDNYLQFLPAAQMYAYDIAGFKHNHTVLDQTKYLVISQLGSVLVVNILKKVARVKRPEGGRTSFPSGHTTNAFTSATVLYKEYKDTSPWLAYSGFAAAGTTGVLRMTNRRHWLPDVLAGAGIGILTVNLVYYWKPFENFNPFKKSENISFAPQIDQNIYGFFFLYNF